MVGATIRVEFDDAEVRVAVTRLLTASRDMIPLMRDIDDPPRGRQEGAVAASGGGKRQ